MTFKFKVGDRVLIKNPDEAYPRYRQFYALFKWAKGTVITPKQNEAGIIRNLAVHPIDNEPIYGIQIAGKEEFCLMNERGIGTERTYCFGDTNLLTLNSTEGPGCFPLYVAKHDAPEGYQYRCLGLKNNYTIKMLKNEDGDTFLSFVEKLINLP